MAGKANDVRDKTRELQNKLYVAAKRSRNRRFHALYDRIHRRDVLERGWQTVRRNKGAAGVDGATIAAIEESGVDQFVGSIQEELEGATYRPRPVRRVSIPKPDGGERHLGIATVRDRVVQAATKLVLEPIFEADFAECSYGFRPRRSAHDALERVRQEVRRGRRWVVDADIRSFFDEIDHGLMVERLKERISDRRVLRLLKGWLRARVLAEGGLLHPEAGTPQGSGISPLLANVYLNPLDWAWTGHHSHLGTLVRYADDVVILCSTRAKAEAALEALKAILGELKLELASGKVRLVNLEDRGESFDFLGFEHRMVESFSRKGHYFCARWPSKKAMGAARARIKACTQRRHTALPVVTIVEVLNRFLVGWGNYFRRGNSTRSFHKLDRYVQHRLALFVSKKHGHSGRGYGLLVQKWHRGLGVHWLVGTVRYGTANAAT